MACECKAEMLAQAEKTIKGQLIKEKFEAESFSAEWENTTLNLAAGKKEIMLGISYEFRAIKKNGVPHERKSKKRLLVKMSHCPFCGTKFEDE